MNSNEKVLSNPSSPSADSTAAKESGTSSSLITPTPAPNTTEPAAAGMLTQYMMSDAIAVHIGEDPMDNISSEESIQVLRVVAPREVEVVGVKNSPDKVEAVQYVGTKQSPCKNEKGKKRKNVETCSLASSSSRPADTMYIKKEKNTDENEVCAFCKSAPCHDIMFGTFCIEDTRQYIKTGFTTEQSLYNHFSKLYHSTYKFHIFKTKGTPSLRKLPIVAHLPVCMMNRSFSRSLLFLREKWRREHARNSRLERPVGKLFKDKDDDDDGEDDSE
jgi:hypothetical protein